MVATDVASRGIGKYCPSPPPPPWQLPAKHLLYFTLVCRGSLDCAYLPEIIVSTWFSTHGVLIRCVASALLYSYFHSCTCLASVVRAWRRQLLIRSSCPPRLPCPEDPVTRISLPGWMACNAPGLPPACQGVKHRWPANMLSYPLHLPRWNVAIQTPFSPANHSSVKMSVTSPMC